MKNNNLQREKKGKADKDPARPPRRPEPPDGRPPDGHPQRPEDIEDPWPIDAYPQNPTECECHPPAAAPPKPCDSPIVKPKGDDCCRQVLEILRRGREADLRDFKLRKQKTNPKIKLANLCCALPVKERLAPILMLILRRKRNGVAPGNTFESKMQAGLSGLTGKKRAALETVLDAYDKVKQGARDCAFETRFDNWPDDKPLEPGFIARNIVGEMLAIGRMVRFGPHPQPFALVGTARPWEQSFSLPGEPGKSAKVKAPWPWICAVGPAANKATDLITDWFRNESQCVPGNIPYGTTNYHSHEFSWVCTVTPDPKGKTGLVDCKHELPGGGGEGWGFGECPGGFDYRVFNKGAGKDVCLEIPDVDPGTEVGLRGLNFLSPDAKIKVKKVDQPPFLDIPAIPLSDWKPDTAAPPDKVTCAVKDHAFFIMPDHIQDPKNELNDIPIPPGRYTLQMIVPNVVNYAPTGGGAPPKEFVSNEVLFDLAPSPNQKYQILTDEARCYEETDGPGSDEPWFRAFTAIADLPKSETKIPFPLLNQVEIMTTDDVDSGEWISFPGATLLSDALGKRVFAAGVIGFEVDSESAARAQIDDFWGAYQEYLSNFFVQLGASTDAGMLGAAVKASMTAGTISGWVWVTGGVLIAIFAAGFLYAAWAPADPIALDSFTFTGRQLAYLTDTNHAHIMGEDFLRIRELRMTSESLGKKDDNAFQSTYSVRRHYRSTVEDSHYGLVYRFKRI